MYRTAVPTLAVLAALTLACSSTPEHGGEFHRGTPTVRPAAPARPGVGAPVVGQPGSRSEVPRSPHQRILPPSKMPGLWAGDKPRASSSDEEPRLLDVLLPAPTADKPDSYRDTILFCAQSMTDVLKERQLFDRATGLNQPQKRCLAATLYGHCANTILKANAEYIKTIKKYDVAAFKRLEDIHNRALRFVSDECQGAFTDEVRSIELTIRAAWLSKHGGGQ